MKKIIFLIMLMPLSQLVSASDSIVYDICTPFGSPVESMILDESSISVRQYRDTYWSLTYPNAQMLTTYTNPSSTRTYNCHGYAWLTSEQGIFRWIGNDTLCTDEDIYWTDGSYTEIASPVYPCKVSYAADDHSAVNNKPLIKQKVVVR
jgi:hypothetical protein